MTTTVLSRLQQVASAFTLHAKIGLDKFAIRTLSYIPQQCAETVQYNLRIQQLQVNTRTRAFRLHGKTLITSAIIIIECLFNNFVKA